ncbi:hypothetical protein B0H63DRAFT_540463 [Podospora didyma]|uniref:DUF8021 domain-containing protein n=1 Tax=Podospora didyma TaxID=330526 RepID=A0AAE0NRR2_9PEZI|nr:hypothetical protein B0H63DRAFT_540463 [Podospora didyma]
MLLKLRLSPVLGLWTIIASAQTSFEWRHSFEGVITSYLAALTAQNSSILPLAADVRYTENTIPLPLGSGLWKIASNPGPYRHDFADGQNQVATITTLEENGIPVIYVARLQLTPAGQISEIETHITRDTAGAERYRKLAAPETIWLQYVPQRLPRDTLLRQVNAYYTGLQRNNPKGNYSSLFDPACDRLENALQTTNSPNATTYGPFSDTDFATLSCEAQFQSGFLRHVTRIRDRRFVVVDEERQAVFAFAMLDHDGTVRTTGDGLRVPEYFDVPRSWHVAEAFRFDGKGIYRVETTKVEVPYGSRAPFDPDVASVSASEVSSGAGVAPLESPCDRTCLYGAVERVLKAMVEHKAGAGLPLAKDVKYSENGRWLDVGDGLWSTLGKFSGPGVDDYAVNFTDTTKSTGGYWGQVIESGTVSGVLSLRVKVEVGFVVEIEANTVRAESRGPWGDSLTLYRPPLPVEYDGIPLGPMDPIFEQRWAGGRAPPNRTADALSAVVTAYFDGFEKHSAAGVPFATGDDSGCVRRDNGLQTNRNCRDQLNGSGGFHPPNGLFNQTTAVRDRRVLVADPSKGIVTAVFMVDNPATGPLPLPKERVVPGAYLISQIFKFDGNGAIARIESFIKWVPLGYASAWSALAI